MALLLSLVAQSYGAYFIRPVMSAARVATVTLCRTCYKLKPAHGVNYLIAADELTPNDPRLSEQWALKNTGGSGGTFGSDISAARGWEMTIGSRQTVIAVIDSGIDLTHAELRSNHWVNVKELANGLDDDHDGFSDNFEGWDFVTNKNEIRDEQGHGTAVAGIIAARGDNGIGIAGVMWRASLMSLRVLDSTGTGDVARAVEAIDYATANGAQVINCSWGTDDASLALREAINRAAQRGVVVVTSAGNNSRDLETAPHYPASFDLPNLIAVAATDNTDILSSFSNWGGVHITIAAPGTGILTTKAGGGYQAVSGTSASTPFVTAVAGLVKTIRPWLGADRTREIILRGARHVPSLSGKVTAKGVVSAARTLDAINTLPPNEGLERRSGNNGGEHGNDGNDQSNQPDNLTGGGRSNNDRDQDGKDFSVTPPARTQIAPGSEMPNLDVLRSKQPTNPQTPVPIPSTRCSHKDPGCALKKRRAAIESPPGLLAWGLNSSPSLSLVDDNSRAVSDSPFQLFWAAPAALSAPLPLPQSNRTNFALASNGSIASASSINIYNGNPFPASRAVNGDRRGVNYLTGGVWQASNATFPQWLQIDFNSSKVLDEIDLFTLQDNYASPSEPTEAMTFTWYGLTGFEVQYWNGSAWVNVPGGNVTSNNKVWRKFSFAALTTNKIRVLTHASADGYSRLAEVEAWGPSAAPSGPQSVVWTNVVGVSASGNNLAKPSGYGWNAGAVSVQSIPSGDGYAEFTTTETNAYRMFGLGNNDSNQNYMDIDYAIEASYDGKISVYEGGIYRSQFGTYSGGDRFRISLTNGIIKYAKNGTVFYTSTVTPIYPLLVDTSLYSAGATITNAIISTGGNGASSDFSMERLDPKNRTGGDGVDLLSRNANWSLPILSFKGRAGLDLGLSLSYNSLVWTKSRDETAIKFDADQGTPSPGFRLGFPVIQPRYYNSLVGVNAYLLITPSGAHVELRQVGASNVYESADSSYLQLMVNGDGTLTLRPTEGSQLTYQLKDDQYQCTQIKDRNGNFITINYDPINQIADTGQLTSIVDTLGRTINFNYDGSLNLNSITQSWGGGVPHEWVTFGWDTRAVNPGFASNLTVVGPQNNTTIPVLIQVGFRDGTRYTFEYNDYAQVSRVRHYAEDNHQLSYTAYTYSQPTSLEDCPRVDDTRVWAEQWNVYLGNLETTTSYSTASDYSSGQMVMPDGTIYKELFATTNNWQRSLVIGTEFWSGGARKKWTTTAYTQDDTGLPYQKNPRITETSISDSDSNHKRTTIDYGQYSQWGLPYQVTEYAADGVTQLRRTFTDYNLGQSYLDRRIIGLPSQVHLADANQWQSKLVYYYDAGGDQLQATAAATTQHDASYGTGFSAGRGNVTAVARYDVTDIANDSKRLITYVGYDTNGSVIFTRDPLGHQINVSYTDAFSDGVNRNTFAYPTTLKDADNNFSTVQYNYYFGAPTFTQSPPPAGFTEGPIQTFEYDAVGRTSRVNNLVNGAYQRWVYLPDGATGSHTTIQTGAPETFQVAYSDGLGRVRAIGGDHPNSASGYLGQYTFYDHMGRVWKTSHPGEMNGSWIPAGEDSGGWIMTLQAYDWKGRPTVTTNPDGTTKLATYGGCGCAGGEVVTLRDEVGRRQKTTADILGRPLKTEVLDWDGNVYSSTTNTYNARDQITSVYEQGSGVTGQTTTLTYDGYGRLKTQQAPSQTYATTYIYNGDDTVQSVTDARGAVSTFTYNNRHLTTGISYSAPTGIAATAAVTFGYDAASNRILMVDGSGSVTYNYDKLSRLTSEARQFTDLPSITRTLSYGYNLANELTSITDSDGKVINYSYDMAGRVTDITGASFASVTQYATNMRYRAWGAVKSASYGDNTSLSASYNLRLLPTDFSVSNASLSKHYEYNADGRLRYSRDLVDDRFDRSYTYDHAGRLTEAFSGPLARGQADTSERPYKLYYNYDALDHLTSRMGRVWNTPHAANTGSGTYLNGKNTGWQHDADGRLTDSSETQYTYDGAGRAVTVASAQEAVTQTQVFDGDGARTKLSTQTQTGTETQYFVRSSVLQRVVTELNQAGQKTRTFVYHGGEVVAWQQKVGTVETLEWEHRDVSNASVRVAGAESEEAELEPMGSDAGSSAAQPGLEGQSPMEYEPYPGFGDTRRTQYMMDGIPVPYEVASQLMDAGVVTTNTQGSSAATMRPGVTPVYGRFCTEIVGLPSAGRDCTNDVVGYTGMEPLGNGALLSYPGPQNHFPALQRDDLKIVQDSIKEAKELTKKKACDQALRKFGIPSLAVLINSLSPNSNLFDGRISTLTGPIGKNGATQSIADYFKENKKDVGAAVFGNNVTKRGSVTFLGDYFFNPPIENIAQQRAIMLLHEVVHQIGAKGDAVFGGSKALSGLIIDNCFPVLKGKLGGVG